MLICTAADMRRLEQHAVDNGSSFLQLMENAGSAAACDLLARYPAPESALIVCGKGNNAGDGLVIARLLAEQGWRIDVYFALGETLSALAAHNRARLPPTVRIHTRLPDAPHTLIIDALFGTGFTGELPDAIAHLCRTLNTRSGHKIALDIPSGLSTDTGHAHPDSFRAELTYAFAALKPAHIHAASYCGHILCLDIGIALTAADENAHPAEQ